MKITLPLPSMILTPNGRGHWAKKAKAVKAARAVAHWQTLQAGKPQTLPTHYRLIYHWPTPRRRRDDDNCVAGAKSYLDGICSALGIDDRTLTLAGLEHDRSHPGRAGMTVEMWSETL